MREEVSQGAVAKVLITIEDAKGRWAWRLTVTKTDATINRLHGIAMTLEGAVDAARQHALLECPKEELGPPWQP